MSIIHVIEQALGLFHTKHVGDLVGVTPFRWLCHKRFDLVFLPYLFLPKVGKWKDYISVIRISNAKGLALSKVGGV